LHVRKAGSSADPYLARIEEKRTELYQRMRKFMEKYEFLLLPVNQVLPFDVNTRYPTEIADVKMENYIAWMKSAYYISVVGNPAISIPCAFSATGLPIGIQIVGRHHREWNVLELGMPSSRLQEWQAGIPASSKLSLVHWKPWEWHPRPSGMRRETTPSPQPLLGRALDCGSFAGFSVRRYSTSCQRCNSGRR